MLTWSVAVQDVTKAASSIGAEAVNRCPADRGMHFDRGLDLIFCTSREASYSRLRRDCGAGVCPFAYIR